MLTLRLFAAACLIALNAGRTDSQDRAGAAPRQPVSTSADPDRDGDGLSDFQEVHKYRTDPAKNDTPGTGGSDGDWQRRREHSYSIRAVVRVMPPYNLKALNDDYQDARVLSETDKYVELEVIAYPLNTNADDIPGNPTWKRDYAGMTEFLKPGVTTNWDERMQKDLRAELKSAGIDPDELTDKEVVERVSRWYFSRGRSVNCFCTNFVYFPGGKPAIFPGLEEAFRRNKGDKAWSDTEQFAREFLGREMFYRKTFGSCTSSAVGQATVLRALGIPTRIIGTIPLVDASDSAQVALVEKNLTHRRVRGTILTGLTGPGKSFANHTYLEVFVGRRWRRLNYSKLGQNTLDPSYFGLMLHVHTFGDLSEANLAPTWGKRYALGERDDTFRHSNPYRTVALDDHFGRYADVPNPPADREHTRLTISRAYWRDAKDAPKPVKDSSLPGGDGATFFLHADEWFTNAGDYLQYKPFLARVDPKFVLRSAGKPDVQCHFDGAFVTLASASVREFRVVVPAEEFAKMAVDTPYTIQPANGNPGYSWSVKRGVTVSRQPSPEEKIETLERKIEQLERRLDALERRGSKP
jgi:hypothetical protein